MNKVEFLLKKKDKEEKIKINYNKLFAIGYSGRNTEKTMEHIKELEEELGVAPPKRIPTIFQCSNIILTKDEEIQVIGNKTCGEAEYVIIKEGDRIYIGIGSDHTDRDLESVSVPKSKQTCPKPIGGIVWDYEDIKDHWDSIKIISYQKINGEEIIYQDGYLADILPVDTIMKELDDRVGDIDNSIIFSGTVPALNGFKFGENFKCEMIDEKLDRKIDLNYNIYTISEEER